MPSTTVNALIVVDAEAEAERLSTALATAGCAITYRRVETECQLLEALADGGWRIVLSELCLPGLDGRRALELVRRSEADIPFVIVSQAIGEEVAVQLMRAGASDCVSKASVARLPAIVERELREADSRQRRRAAEQAVKESQLRYQSVFQQALDAMYVCDGQGRIVEVNQRAVEDYGYLSAEIIGKHMRELHPGWEGDRITELWTSLEHAQTACVEMTARRLDGGEFSVSIVARTLEVGRQRLVLVIARNLQEQKQVAEELQRKEAELRQAQKMEAVGRLAGGIAHDFNNLLTAIITCGDFVRRELEPNAPLHEDMSEVLAAAERAEHLTQQLLAFSRRRAVQPRVLDVNECVEKTDRMLRRLVGEDVAIETRLSREAWPVRIDPSALDQVLVNLAVNARDALPNGGKMTIETYNSVLDDAFARERAVKLPPGEYLVLAVSDDGTGMSEETRRRIFDPFFTTKPSGKGTGLGLSTCYGIVKQAKGYIGVYSEIDKGTTVKVYLPHVRAKVVRPATERAASDGPVAGDETILVVEDEALIRRITCRALEKFGFRVVSAGSAQEALSLCKPGSGRVFDLLLTDFVMPQMSGSALAERILAERPDTKVLYMSGYAASAIMHQGELDESMEFISKPFAAETLARKVRSVLDA